MPLFDPNAACIPNGHFFSFPYNEDEADLVLITVPWDVTTSYNAGAADGPMAILNASYQLDFYDFFVPKAWELKIGTCNKDFAQIRESSRKMRPIAQKIMEAETSINSVIDNSEISEDLENINAACGFLNEWVEEQCTKYLQMGKKVGLIGGDHSVPLGYYKALSNVYPSFGILHIDAHADLRSAYEGFTYSHASIMFNALNLEQNGKACIERLVQLGIRDVCEAEMQIAKTDNRVYSFSDAELRASMYEGKSWAQVCMDIIDTLPQNIYISLDIDGLNPSLCPNTGTPVPGGISFEETRYLLELIRRSGKQVIGFDLCEVAPNKLNPQDEWDGNVGARILYQLCITSLAPGHRKI